MRADLFVANELNISRNKASELLNEGKVLIDDEIKKPSANISENAKCTLLSDVYVSRAAYKLKGFLQEFELGICGEHCLDVGSSTGGFTQVLLENNARSVTCVDVGSNQLHESLRQDSRVKVYENTDIRDFNHESFRIVVCDVSFISINLIIKDLIRLSSEYLILLFKPQFEVGKAAKRSKTGVVKDEKAINKACLEFETNLARLGLRLLKKAKSNLSGKDGNYEYFYAYTK